MGRSASVIIPPNKKLFAEKIKVNEVKNIDNNSKNLLEQNKINKIKIKIKLPKEKIQTHLINTMKTNQKKFHLILLVNFCQTIPYLSKGKHLRIYVI